MIFYFPVNCILIGISEETMFRGVLVQGLRSKLQIWPAIITATFLFGSVHMLHAIATREFAQSVLQALTAAMPGLIFIAIVYHALWDFCTFTFSSAGSSAASSSDPRAVAYLLPLVLVLPNFVDALHLLRNIRNNMMPGHEIKG
jgi:membrane protease YdiL (CAAX protease family)